MKLHSYLLEIEAEKQAHQASDQEIEMIKQKRGYFQVCNRLIVLTSLFILIGIYCLIKASNWLALVCIFLLILIPKTITTIKQNKVCSCYATVVWKEIRYFKASAKRKPPTVIPYQRTESETAISDIDCALYQICTYYYCFVEINGKQYDHVFCHAEDFLKIKTGDRVLIATIGRESEPIIYAVEM